MRIYELAKKHNCSSKEIQTILDELKITYKTHSSSIPEEILGTVEEKLSRLLSSGSGTPDSSPSTPAAETDKTESSKKTVSAEDLKSKKHEKKSAEASLKTKSKKDSHLPAKNKTVSAETSDDDKTFAETTLETLPEENVDIEKYEKVFEEIFEEEQYIKRKATKTKFSPKTKDAETDTIEGASDKTAAEFIPETKEPIVVNDGLSVKELAEATNIPASEIIKKLFLLGMIASINQSLDKDTILIVADEFKLHLEVKAPEQDIVKKIIEKTKETEQIEEALEVRAPVVTIMGHVDHGKTTLLDTIRKTKIVDTEAGGITQHIGAYMVEHKGSKICFIDTPGHAAFTSMRAMGANVTDIVVLVVAANDGIQPQTIESISHAREAQVPIIVAINKVDLDFVNPDKIKADLAPYNITPEEWGGDNLFIPVSALKGQGIDELLDAINLQAELLELKANPKGKPFGIILESCQTNQLGPVATVLVKNGVISVGDPVVCGHVYGKIRRMENDRGEIVEKATPSMPVKVYGFTDVPEVAAKVKVYPSDREAKDAAKKEEESRRHNMLNKRDVITLDNLYSSLQNETKKEFKIVLKADFQGSIAALNSLLLSITSEKVKLKIIHSATGAVTDTDVSLAQAYGAIIFAFNVKVSPSAQVLAKRLNVKIPEYQIIYKLYEDVVKAMEGLLDFETVEKAIGACEVKKIFKISKVGAIAGSLVIEGKILKSAYGRIKRGGQRLSEQAYKIATLKHYKEDVSEVKMGTECGVQLDGFHEFEEGDIIEFHILEKTASSL